MATPTLSAFQRRLSTLLYKFSHKNISFGCNLVDDVTRGGPLCSL